MIMQNGAAAPRARDDGTTHHGDSGVNRDIIAVASKPQASAPRNGVLILPAGEAPHGALTWRNPQQKNERLRQWRRVVMQTFGHQARALRILWLLRDMFRLEGYCDANDRYLSEQTGIAPNKVGDTLTLLDKSGAICRVHRVDANGNRKRHIYPARTLLPQNGGLGTFPVSGGMTDPDPRGGGIPRQKGRHTFNRKTALPSTLVYAQRSAEERERRALEERPAGNAGQDMEQTTERRSVPRTPNPVKGEDDQQAQSDSRFTGDLTVILPVSQRRNDYGW